MPSSLTIRAGPENEGTLSNDLATALRSLAREFEAERFGNDSLRLLVVVRPRESADDWVGHGLSWKPDPASPRDSEGRFTGRRLKVWIASTGDSLRPLASGLAEPATGWLTSDDAAIKVRPYFFGTLEAIRAFAAIAKRAGEMVGGLSAELAEFRTAELVNPSTLTADPFARWLLSLFVFGWRGLAGDSLSAWRGYVDARGAAIRLPFDRTARDNVARVRISNSAEGSEERAYFQRLLDIPGLPDDFVSVLRTDVFQASARECEALRERIAADVPGNGKERPKSRPHTQTDSATANARAIDSLTRHPDMAEQPASAWAKELGVSASRVRNLKAWKFRQKARRPRATASSHDKHIADGEQELDRLIDEQEAEQRAEKAKQPHRKRV